MHPVGPLPASTYWRRRAVLLVVLVVVLIVLKSCAGGGATNQTPRTHPSPTVSVSVSASPRPSATTSTPPVAGGVCPDSALKLVVTTDATTYSVGSSPRFTLTVTNTSAAACTRDLGSKVVALEVVSGTARTWNSDDCNQGQVNAVATLAPGKARQVVQLTWSGKRSQRGCPTPRDSATAGTYQVSGTVGTLTSPRVVFHFQ
ncbi:MAG: hypothetical protein QOG99_1957 [Frankiales bacterium]|jgi:hypothetical protein|nr:hypothetical protein [Frankiales bacterium]